MRQVLAAVGMLGYLVTGAAHGASPQIEPRSLQLNLVSSADMARVCREHGQRANCRGMAAWDREFRQCIVWVATPLDHDVLDHELRHCQEGHFHD